MNLRVLACAFLLSGVLLQGCTSGGGVEKQPVAAVQKPQVVVDEKKLWRNEYEPLEGEAIGKQDLPMLTKFSKIRYNTAIASYNDGELRKHLQRGEIDARLALQTYEKNGGAHDTWEYAELLHQLALYDEKLANFAEAQEYMTQALAQKVNPPRDARSMFWAKSDLARIYTGAQNFKAASQLTDELRKTYEHDPQLRDAQLVIWQQWIDAHDHMPGEGKEVDRMRALLEKTKSQRAKLLEKEADSALTVEKAREK